MPSGRVLWLGCSGPGWLQGLPCGFGAWSAIGHGSSLRADGAAELKEGTTAPISCFLNARISASTTQSVALRDMHKPSLGPWRYSKRVQEASVVASGEYRLNTISSFRLHKANWEEKPGALSRAANPGYGSVGSLPECTSMARGRPTRPERMAQKKLKASLDSLKKPFDQRPVEAPSPSTLPIPE